MDSVFLRIPLFPLPAVLMPGTPLPLHIFEERYRMLIRRCIETGEEFGVVFITGTQVRSVGCTAEIVQVMKKYEDGRFDLMTQGKRRFTIGAIHDELPYLEGSVHYFNDEEGTDADSEALIHSGVRLIAHVSALAEVDMDPAFLKKLSNEELSFVLAGTCSTDLEERQALLELRSTGERLSRSVLCLEQSVLQMRYQKKLAALCDGEFQPEDFRN